MTEALDQTCREHLLILDEKEAAEDCRVVPGREGANLKSVPTGL